MMTRLLVHDPTMAFPVFREVEVGAQDLLSLGPKVLSDIAHETAKQYEYYDLGGADGESPYDTTLKDLDHLIGALKRARQAVQAMAAHTHEWSSNEYCMVCGADGRA